MIPNIFQNNLKNRKHLTTRQYRLYDFLCENPSQWFKAKEIQETLAIFYPWYGEEKDFTGIIGKQINDDVRLIREAVGIVFDKLIVSNRSKGYKVATPEEFKTFYKSQHQEAIRKLARLSIMSKHSKMHGQGKIFFQEEPNGRKQYTVYL
jgi:hypothetical protein